MTDEEFMKLPLNDPRVQERLRLALRRLYRQDLSTLDEFELEEHFWIRDTFLSMIEEGQRP